MSLIDDLLNGRMKLHELERHLPADEAVRVRREFRGLGGQLST